MKLLSWHTVFVVVLVLVLIKAVNNNWLGVGNLVS